jgi:23S rRNA pseudouridine1911/1915/1917 synthase
MTNRTTVLVDRGDFGVRIDRVLLRHLAHIPGLTRNRLQRLIDGGRVCVNGQPVSRASRRVAATDAITVELPARPVGATPTAEDIRLSIVYEDRHVLVVNKPCGQVAHPAFRNRSGTLLNAILAHANGRWQPALLSRLDKDTSGLVLVAKAPTVQTALQRLGNANRIEKDYLAIVLGGPPSKGTIDLALDRDPWDRRRVIVRDRGGVPSVTRFKRLRSIRVAPGRTVTLLECRLITGRTHQIRVHLAAKGWPIVGDPLYGKRVRGTSVDACLPAIARQALHAWRLAFTHPVTAERIEVTAPIPDDMAHVLETTGLGRAGDLNHPSTRAMSIRTVPSAE